MQSQKYIDRFGLRAPNSIWEALWLTALPIICLLPAIFGHLEPLYLLTACIGWAAMAPKTAKYGYTLSARTRMSLGIAACVLTAWFVLFFLEKADHFALWSRVMAGLTLLWMALSLTAKMRYWAKPCPDRSWSLGDVVAREGEWIRN